MTHEEIAIEAIQRGRRDGDTGLESLGQELLEAVENEQDSQPIVDRINKHLEF